MMTSCSSTMFQANIPLEMRTRIMNDFFALRNKACIFLLNFALGNKS